MAAPKVGINQRSFRQKLAEYRHQPLSLFLLIATLLAAAITVFILFSLILYILVKGIPAIRPEMFAWKYTTSNNSMMPSIINTLEMVVLIARIKAVLRRSAPSEEEQEYVLGDLYVNPTRHIVRVGKEPVSLTLKEFELLCLLLEHQGVVFTRDRLLNHIWGYAFDGESRTVDVHVRHLRQKLGECGKYIETVRGIGYRAGDGES